MNQPYQSQINPASVTTSVASYILDYSNGTEAPFIKFSSQALSKQYVTVPLTATPPLSNGGFSLAILNLPLTDSGFGLVRGIGFQYRPFYVGNDYFDPGVFLQQYAPTVILFNTRTKASVFIRANKIFTEYVTIAATQEDFSPLSINVQGNVPFFASLQDTIEICSISPNNVNYGKLILNLYNFDVQPWYETCCDGLYPIT